MNSQADPKKKEHPKTIVTAAKVVELLGPQKYREQEKEKKNEIGATLGLAWTEVGGSILGTEAARYLLAQFYHPRISLRQIVC